MCERKTRCDVERETFTCMAAKMAMINLGEQSQRPMHRLAAETRVCSVARPAPRESGIPTTRSPLWGLAWPGLSFESPIPAALCWKRGKRGLGDSHSVPVSAYPDLITMDGAARFGVGRGALSKAIAECQLAEPVSCVDITMATFAK